MRNIFLKLIESFEIIILSISLNHAFVFAQISSFKSMGAESGEYG